MQINFTPHKLRAAKAYIKQLAEEEKVKATEQPVKAKPSLFKKIIHFLFK